MIVTISGPPGSGKSTVSRGLAEITGWRIINAGQVFRDLAAKRGMSLADFGELAAKDYSIDKELDTEMISIARNTGSKALSSAEETTGENLILEGRLMGALMHREGISSLKVFIDASIEIRAQRISGREDKTIQQARCKRNGGIKRPVF